jgi:hypothetical protein
MPPLYAELSSDGTCMLRAGDVERWRVTLDFGEAAAWNPFRDAIVWPRAERIVAGAGDRVHWLHLETGKPCATLDLSPDHFGHLALIEITEGSSTTELLLVLGWTDVRAYDANAVLRWHARDVAVDGITFDEVRGSILRLHAEMDPPGGWFAVSLDPATGQEIDRQPDFLPGYLGLYGEGPNEASEGE